MTNIIHVCSLLVPRVVTVLARAEMGRLGGLTPMDSPAYVGAPGVRPLASVLMALRFGRRILSASAAQSTLTARYVSLVCTACTRASLQLDSQRI